MVWQLSIVCQLKQKALIISSVRTTICTVEAKIGKKKVENFILMDQSAD